MSHFFVHFNGYNVLQTRLIAQTDYFIGNKLNGAMLVWFDLCHALRSGRQACF